MSAKAKEYYEKTRNLIAQAQTILDEPGASKDATKMAQVDGLLNEAETFKRLADQDVAIKDVDDDKPIRPPFDTAEEPGEDDKAWEAVEVKGAVKALAMTVHGKGYPQLLALKSQAFGKWLRRGEGALTAEERGVMGQVVLTPAQMAEFVKGGLDAAAIKDLTEGVDTGGGFVAPEDFRGEIIRALPGLTIVRQRARVVPTNRDTVVIPKVTGAAAAGTYTSAVRVEWVEETTGPAGDTEPAFGQERIPVYTAMAKTQLSNNLLEDAGTDVAALLAELYAEAYAQDEDNQFLVGTSQGAPKGILPGGANQESITECISGDADTIVADYLIAMQDDLPGQYQANAVWIMNSATKSIIRQLKSTLESYLWQPGIAAGVPDTLLGKPWLTSEFMPDVAAGYYPILYGDLRRAYWIADRVGMTIQRLIEKYAETNEVGFVGRRRLGGQLVFTPALRVMKISAS